MIVVGTYLELMLDLFTAFRGEKTKKIGFSPVLFFCSFSTEKIRSHPKITPDLNTKTTKTSYAVIVSVAIPELLISAVAYLDRIVRLGVKPNGYGCRTAGT